MSEIAELNKRLLAHSTELMEKSYEFMGLAHDAAHSRNEYDMAKSRARLTIATDSVMGKWKVDEKTAQVMIMCEQQMVKARIAEAMVDACKMRLRAVEASLSAVQSQARLLKVDSQLDNYRT